MDYGARMYMPEIGRFLTPDAFSEKYFAFAPYQYALNNPVLFVDINGDSVNVSEMNRKDRRELKKDLAAKTGLKIFRKNRFFQYRKDSNGQAKVGNSEGTSEKARNLLVKAIDDQSTLNVTSGDRSQTHDGTNDVELSGFEISMTIGEASEGLNNTTMGWALTFFHEYFHSEMGGGLEDTKVIGEPGPIVERVNEIRAELGLDYGQRENTLARFIPLGMEGRYLPLTQSFLTKRQTEIFASIVRGG